MIREQFRRGNAEPRVNQDENRRSGMEMIVVGRRIGKR